MATLKIHDRAEEFRIEIAGRFAGDCVDEVFAEWKQALTELKSRRFCVNISRLTGYDSHGKRVLRDIYEHGTHIAAGTPASLAFLQEISAPVRSPAVVVEAVPHRREAPSRAPKSRPVAAGE
jgi:hypothetical protein